MRARPRQTRVQALACPSRSLGFPTRVPRGKPQDLPFGRGHASPGRLQEEGAVIASLRRRGDRSPQRPDPRGCRSPLLSNPPTHTHSTRHPCDVRTPPWAPSHGAWTAEGRGVPRAWRVRARSAQASGTPEEHAPDRSRLRGWWGVGSRGGEGQGGNEAMRGEAGRGHRAPTPPAWRLLCPAEGRAISRPPARKAWAPGPSWGLQYHHFTSSPFEQEGRS